MAAQHKLKVIKRTVTEKTIVKWRKFETRGSVLIANDQRNAPGDTKERWPAAFSAYSADIPWPY